MLRRKMEAVLEDWKAQQNHKPLIIKGCRQCGKTYSVRDFASKNYKHVVYLNFFENPEYSSVFEGALDVDTIVMLLSACLEKTLSLNRETRLLFLMKYRNARMPVLL